MNTGAPNSDVGVVAAVGEAGESSLLLLLLLQLLLSIMLLALGVGLVADSDGTLMVVSATMDGAATTDGSVHRVFLVCLV